MKEQYSSHNSKCRIHRAHQTRSLYHHGYGASPLAISQHGVVLPSASIYTLAIYTFVSCPTYLLQLSIQKSHNHIPIVNLVWAETLCTGLIWGGAPRDQISSFGSSLGMYFRSAEAVRTRRYGVDSASLLRSNSAEVVFDRCKRLAGVSSTPLAGTPSRGNNRRRSPSPARCRQLQRDTIR